MRPRLHAQRSPPGRPWGKAGRPERFPAKRCHAEGPLRHPSLPPLKAERGAQCQPSTHPLLPWSARGAGCPAERWTDKPGSGCPQHSSSADEQPPHMTTGRGTGLTRWARVFCFTRQVLQGQRPRQPSCRAYAPQGYGCRLGKRLRTCFPGSVCACNCSILPASSEQPVCAKATLSEHNRASRNIHDFLYA